MSRLTRLSPFAFSVLLLVMLGMVYTFTYFISRAGAEPGTYPGSPQLADGGTTLDAQAPRAHLYAVFYNGDKQIVNALVYHNRDFDDVEACKSFLTEGARSDISFQAALEALRPVVQQFAEKFPDGALRMVCSVEAPKIYNPNEI